MSLDWSELEILPSVEDCVFLKSPDDDLGLEACRHKHQETRHHDNVPKGRQKRFRPKRFESLKSPPLKRKHCDSRSPNDVLACMNSMSFDCFFHSTPKKQNKLPMKRSNLWQRRKPRDSCFVVKSKEMKVFFKLTEDDVIRQFLSSDSCCRIADKYLLAMVFAYFKRADLTLWEYTRFNFFIALYLANDVEEDEEEMKYEIFPWALGKKWKDKYPHFLKKRDKLLRLIDYKAIVSRRCSDEIMAIEPDHPLWKRERPQHHAGAIRSYMKDPEDDGYPRGPHVSPRYCSLCEGEDSQYDSASPSSVSWCVVSADSTPDRQHSHIDWVSCMDAPPTQSCSFDMNGLRKTLPMDNDVDPSKEE